jgi:hypothetical protein
MPHPKPRQLIRSEAYLSDDRRYRYWLLRVWDNSLPMMANLGANPSTADESQNDPTIRKDMGFAERLGFGGLLKLNVGGFRATYPKDWYRAADPFGPENSIAHLLEYLAKFKVQTTVLAWGRCIGRFKNRGETIAANIPNAMCFGKNPDGTPRHTLMLPYSTKLESWGGR